MAAPPQLKTWLPWSELAKTPRLTLDEFRSVLCQYPRSALLIACARLSMIFNYGPDAETAANEETTAKWIPALFPPSLVTRVKTFASQGRVIFFQGQLRYLAAEVTRLEEAHERTRRSFQMQPSAVYFWLPQRCFTSRTLSRPMI